MVTVHVSCSFRTMTLVQEREGLWLGWRCGIRQRKVHFAIQFRLDWIFRMVCVVWIFRWCKLQMCVRMGWEPVLSLPRRMGSSMHVPPLRGMDRSTRVHPFTSPRPSWSTSTFPRMSFFSSHPPGRGIRYGRFSLPPSLEPYSDRPTPVEVGRGRGRIGGGAIREHVVRWRTSQARARRGGMDRADIRGR